MKRSTVRSPGRRGFLLFEAMIAVAIFSLAVLALGRCVDNCLRAEMQLQDDDRARRALENRMTEIESGSIRIGQETKDDLKDYFKGMSLHQSSELITLKNENDEEITGLSLVTLELTWKNRGEDRSRSLQFYVMPRNR